jgi:hypothetical protein
MYKGKRPDRTLKILSKNDSKSVDNKQSLSKMNLATNFIDLKNIGGDSSLMNKMKMIEEHFTSNP